MQKEIITTENILALPARRTFPSIAVKLETWLLTRTDCLQVVDRIRAEQDSARNDLSQLCTFLESLTADRMLRDNMI